MFRMLLAICFAVSLSSCGGDETPATSVTVTDTTAHHANDGHDHGDDGHAHGPVEIAYEDYLSTGEKLIQQGEFEQGAIQFLDAIRKDSNRVEGWYGLGFCYTQMGSYDFATRYFKEVVRMEPGYRNIYYNYGSCLVNTGQADSAIVFLTKAIEQDAECGDCYFNRGSAYLMLENRDAAKADLEQAKNFGQADAQALLDEKFN